MTDQPVTESVVDHLYLPGAAHPLASSSSVGVSSRQGRLEELAIMDIDIVVFPGDKLPIRMSEYSREWITYLGAKIDEARANPSTVRPVRFGVLTRDGRRSSDEARSRRQSWTRRGMGSRRLTQISQRLVVELGNLSDNDTDEPALLDREEGSHASTSTQASDNEPMLVQRSYRPIDSDSEDDRPTERPLRPPNRRPSTTNSPIGRIGTIVTVVATHGDSLAESSSDSAQQLGSSHVWRSHVDGPLVLSAVGTSRFCIVRASDDDSGPPRAGRVNRYLVEELQEDPLGFPSAVAALYDKTSVAGSLACLSPWPEHVYRGYWPWRLVQEIRETLARIPTYAGVVGALPSLDQPPRTGAQAQLLEPQRFSYWLASNLPFSMDDKLSLLELYTTLERLRVIHAKTSLAEEADSIIHCKQCAIPLTKATHLFTVGDAQGTTGNYVNEHGFVHQTITVRQLDEDEVRWQGVPETRDSWFPGYSWTIMSCAFCQRHLGWKFRKVGAGAATSDRPNSFYGLSAASVATYVPETTRSRRRSTRSFRH